MKSMIAEFKDFINKGDVVTIAVGLVMALYFKAIVDAIIAGVITPIISAIFGESDISRVMTFTINGSEFSIGLILKAAIDFVIVAFVLFLLIKAYNSWKGDDEEEEAADPGPSEIELLTQIRDSLQHR